VKSECESVRRKERGDVECWRRENKKEENVFGK
jgi:hypothetical protein